MMSQSPSKCFSVADTISETSSLSELERREVDGEKRSRKKVSATKALADIKSRIALERVARKNYDREENFRKKNSKGFVERADLPPTPPSKVKKQ